METNNRCRLEGEGKEVAEWEPQYQYCVKTSMPTTPNMEVWPVLDCREKVAFLPPASIMPSLIRVPAPQAIPRAMAAPYLT